MRIERQAKRMKVRESSIVQDASLLSVHAKREDKRQLDKRENGKLDFLSRNINAKRLLVWRGLVWASVRRGWVPGGLYKVRWTCLSGQNQNINKVAGREAGPKIPSKYTGQNVASYLCCIFLLFVGSNSVQAESYCTSREACFNFCSARRPLAWGTSRHEES